jgi:hypothetical protein
MRALSSRDVHTVKTIKSEKAKQGRWGVPLLVILVIGMLLALVVWGGVEIYGEKIAQPQPGKTLQGGG